MGGAAGLLLLMAAEASDLTLPFGESSRPRVCAPASPLALDPASTQTAWDRARRGPLDGLCQGLARAQVRLAREPALALAAARQLDQSWPGRAEPRVLEARALLALGDAASSWKSWEAAREIGHDLGEPRDLSAYALRDYALTAVATGHTAAAVAAYRRLISLLEAWPDPRHVQRSYLEAAGAALRAVPPHFDEAFGYLAAAQSGATSTGLRAFAEGLQALALGWSGAARAEASRLDAAEVWHFVALARGDTLPSYWPALPRHEVYAVASLLVEPYSEVDAAELWERYVSGLAQTSPEPAIAKYATERQRRLHGFAGAAR
jgi:hypothetical protein